ncbi:heterokaryon incompatibility protein-domain-containing protein [Cercophora newfieldiana]|uniref:Heterokaryon incompatibility protein-domain-containing protein n=1 Tax=Cercophora newfieldiana TaxID=92897 RepID=A0AA39XX49_9PEZI|nr:heterokaryon incompatibility protein-domain-containing protein [Cercophora newfieldiana]
MRLINVNSLEVEVFLGSNVPKYAILSHTWESEEVSLQQWTSRLTRLRKLRSAGFNKIRSACKQASRDGLRYLWADTACIDKSSSAELSEAINSMYAWYEKATICYVFLADVAAQPQGELDTLDLVRRSRWFTRGWTLQELVAPGAVVFYSKEWTELGTKNALAVLISRVTGIDEVCLQKKKRLEEYSIAQRMAWAANRVTTREEDMAYCLLGIFGINMPLLYGEGRKAFRRLQEEILKVSDDHSILAFDTDLSEGTLFAHHPSVFTRGRRIHPNFAHKLTAPFSMTNAGLSISTPLIQTLSPYWVLALLNCVEIDENMDMKRSLIYLPLLGKDNRFMRARTPVSIICKTLGETASSSSGGEIQDLIGQTETSYYITYFNRVYNIYGTEMDITMKGFELGVDMAAPMGFMIAFPRGTAGYRLQTAYPHGSLRPDISFFIPRASSFKDLYLAAGAEPSKEVWMCRIVDIPDEFEPKDAEMVLARINRASGLPWARYHHSGNAIVEANTRFKTLRGDPCTEAVMVEIVFDVDALLQERQEMPLRTNSNFSSGIS